MLAEDEQKAEQSSGVFIANAQIQVGNLQSKLQRLLDGYLDQDIDRTTYQEKQSELMSEKKSLEEQISKHTLANNVWVEPMRQWLKQAILLRKTAKSGDFVAIKDALLKIEGLNLFLKSKKAQPTAAQNVSSPRTYGRHSVPPKKKPPFRATISNLVPLWYREPDLNRHELMLTGF